MYNRHCQKCEAGIFNEILYMDGTDCEDTFAGKEHLHYACSMCGYVVPGPCADYVAKIKRES